MYKKLTFALGLILSCSLILFGCTNNDIQDSTSTTPPQKVELKEGFKEANFGHTTVFENDEIKIDAQGLFTNQDNQAVVDLTVLNKTDNELDIEADNVIINDYLISTTFDCKVKPQTTDQLYLFIASSEHNSLTEANIQDIRSIKFNFEVDIDNKDEYETGWSDEIKTNKYPLEDSEPSLGGTPILEDDNIKIVGLGIPQKTKDIPEYFNLFCENTTDKDLEFEVEVISINNIDTDDFDFDVDLPAHTKYVGGIKLFPEDLKKLGIENSVLINEIVLQAKVKDNDKTIAQGEEHTFAYNVKEENK